MGAPLSWLATCSSSDIPEVMALAHCSLFRLLLGSSGSSSEVSVDLRFFSDSGLSAMSLVPSRVFLIVLMQGPVSWPLFNSVIHF